MTTSKRTFFATLAALFALGVALSFSIDTTDDGHGHKTRTLRIGVGKQIR